MTEFEVIATLTTMAALFAWLNHRFVRLPTTIGLMVISLVLSLVLVLSAGAGVTSVDAFLDFVALIDFDEVVLQGMLGALLFAGALHVDLDDLRRQWGVISALATLGVMLSTVLVGSAMWLVLDRLGPAVPFVYCLLLGAVVSPTDPVAVAAILKKAGVPESLLAKVTGESLFNDGVGVVVFLVIAGVAAGSGEATTLAVAELLVVEVLGGVAFGGAIGWISYQMLRTVDNYSVEILVTLAIVTGGYAAAHHLHLSGPLAVVVAGLFLGNRGRAFAMSATTRRRLDEFWELADEFLNAVLFVLIGVEIVVVALDWTLLRAAALAIPIVLFARWASVAAPVTALRAVRSFTPHAVTILTWAGLKGGISVALALSLPPGPHRDVIVTITYVVVCWSIIVQGLTVGWVVRRLSSEGSSSASPVRPSPA